MNRSSNLNCLSLKCRGTNKSFMIPKWKNVDDLKEPWNPKTECYWKHPQHLSHDKGKTLDIWVLFLKNYWTPAKFFHKKLQFLQGKKSQTKTNYQVSHQFLKCKMSFKNTVNSVLKLELLEGGCTKLKAAINLKKR